MYRDPYRYGHEFRRGRCERCKCREWSVPAVEYCEGPAPKISDAIRRIFETLPTERP